MIDGGSFYTGGQFFCTEDSAHVHKETRESIRAGSNFIPASFEYDGGSGFGHCGEGTLFVVGERVVQKHIPHSMGIRISPDETFDVGANAGEPISTVYHVPHEFEGKLNRVDVHLGDAALSK